MTDADLLWAIAEMRRQWIANPEDFRGEAETSPPEQYANEVFAFLKTLVANRDRPPHEALVAAPTPKRPPELGAAAVVEGN